MTFINAVVSLDGIGRYLWYAVDFRHLDPLTVEGLVWDKELLDCLHVYICPSVIANVWIAGSCFVWWKSDWCGQSLHSHGHCLFAWPSSDKHGSVRHLPTSTVYIITHKSICKFIVLCITTLRGTQTTSPMIRWLVNDDLERNGRGLIEVLFWSDWGKGKAIPLQAWTGREGSRRLRLPYFVATAQDGGKVLSRMHRPPLPPRKYSWYSFLLEPESTPGS